jgi:hypothetical protein
MALSEEQEYAPRTEHVDESPYLDVTSIADSARLESRGVPGRRTITITGYGSSSYAPSRRRPQEALHRRPGFQPDRFAMWAVLLGLLLVLVAATSSHAATHAAHAVSSALVAHR